MIDLVITKTSLAINILMMLTFELIQCYNGQVFQQFVIDFALFGLNMFITATTKVQPYTLMAIFIYQCVETISWIQLKTSMTFLVVSSFDMGWVWKYHKEMLLILPICLSILLFFVLLERIKNPDNIFHITSDYLQMAIIIELILLMPFSRSVYYSLYPFSKEFFPINIDKDSELANYFMEEPKLLKTPPIEKMKNLILIQVESFEQQTMGKYNKYYPNLMPFITKLSEQGTFFSNMIPQEYTTWTTASMLASHCGLPHVVSDLLWGFLMKTKVWPNVSCFTDFLHMAGYKQYAAGSGGFDGMGMKEIFEEHNVQVRDHSYHKQRHDWDAVDYVIEKMFPDLESQKKPFYLFFTNDDTHPFFNIDKRCKNRIPDGSRVVRAFDCYDQNIERLIRAFDNSSFRDNTILAVYGDHLMIGEHTGLFEMPRKLALFFPYMKKQEITKQTSLYDMIHTLMKLLEIEYSPKFPFGTDLFSENVGSVPQKNDFAQIYQRMRKMVKKPRGNKMCKGLPSFCHAVN